MVKTQRKSTNKNFKNNSKKETFLEIRKIVEKISVFLLRNESCKQKDYIGTT